MASNVISEKKKALLALKQKLLNELEYYDRRIKDARARATINSYNYDDSSDSDTGLPVLDLGPSITEMKIQKSKLKTCLQATQELTGLQVLQSEVNIMVEDPVLDGEKPVTEAGTWREVTAECRINHLPFSIMFYVHKPNGMFGPVSYRGVRVSAVKAAHEAELAASVLTTVDTPADAVQVLRSYTVAYRSRRATLAQLAERYGDTLFMEPNSQGGFVLKCANLLEVLWRLENSRSPLAPFQHNMKFNFEYMDECYVKIITHAHKELSKSSIDTEERTFLLSKIISTCLEVQGSTQIHDESMESEPESAQRVQKRQSTLDREMESPEEKRKREVNIMAPPKYLPKRVKPKGKENSVENSNKGVKRTSSNDGLGSKRAKISEVGNVKSVDNHRGVQGNGRDENNKKTNKKVGQSEVDKASGIKHTVTDLVNKKNVVENIDKTKKAEENTTNNVDKAKRNVKATSNDPISAKSQVTNDNLNTKDPKGENGNHKNLNLPKKSVIANQNAKTKETDNTNAKTKELNVAGTTKKQKSLENLKGNDNDNISKKSMSNKNTVNQNPNSVTKNGETSSTVAKKSKTGNKIPENTNLGVRNDNAKTNLTKKQKESDNTPENQNAVPNEIVASTKINKKSKTSDKMPENKNPTNEIAKNELAKKSKSENLNKLKPVVTKTQENPQNNIESSKIKSKVINTVKNGVDGTKPTVNKNKEQNAAKINEKKSVASAKDKANTNVASSKNKESNTVQKVTEKNVAISKNAENNTVKKVTEKNLNTNKNAESNTVKKVTDKNVATNKNKDNIVDVATGNVASVTKQSKDNLNNVKSVQNKPISTYNNKPPLKILNKHNMPKKVARPSSSGTFLKPGTTEKKDGGKITSKIPQKALKTISESAIKKNPLRISPRKMASMFKSPSRPNLNQKMHKSNTNIPRLLKTSGTKAKS